MTRFREAWVRESAQRADSTAVAGDSMLPEAR